MGYFEVINEKSGEIVYVEADTHHEAKLAAHETFTSLGYSDEQNDPARFQVNPISLDEWARAVGAP